MSEALGTFTVGDEVSKFFNTKSLTSAPITLAGGAVRVYKDGSAVESGAGVSLTVDFDSTTGLHLVTIDTSADATFYTANTTYTLVLTAGTVDSISVAGTTLASWSLVAAGVVRPTAGGPAAGAVPALTLITAAFYELNVFMPGESIPNSDAQLGLDTLNGMLGDWVNDRFTIPALVRSVFDFVVGQGGPLHPYTVGPGGDFDCVRPVNSEAIRRAALVQNDLEYPVGVLSPGAWATLTIKSLPGPLPRQCFYNPTFVDGLGALYYWPVPNVTTYRPVLYLDQALTTFGDLTTAYQVPPGYRNALVYNLALALATPYSREPPATLTAKAMRSLMLLKRANIKTDAMQNAFVGATRYDILTDQLWSR